jgi:DNA-binding CsgD family transcriptional regulator
VESPLALHASSPSELEDRLQAERRGKPFLVYRDEDDRQRLVELSATATRLTVGRSPENDIALTWDEGVSRLHAEFERLAGRWTLADDGLSTNGSFANGTRITGRRRLRDRDALRFGSTTIVYLNPRRGESKATIRPDDMEAIPRLSDAERAVLVGLCRSVGAGPATNPQIAADLHLSVETVKTHLRALFHKFGIAELAQNQKRLRLMELAFLTGLVPDREGVRKFPP